MARDAFTNNIRPLHTRLSIIGSIRTREQRKRGVVNYIRTLHIKLSIIGSRGSTVAEEGVHDKEHTPTAY